MISAQTLSSGCSAVLDPSPNGLYTFSTRDGDFLAGEALEISAGYPQTFGPTTGIFLEVDGVEVDTDGFPGILSYRFPAIATAINVNWGTTDMSSNVTWTVQCSPAVAAVPTMPPYGLALLSGLLGLIGILRLRKIKC